MISLQAFLICFIALLLTFPGVLVTYSLFKHRSKSEVFFLGSLMGLLAVIYLERLFPLKLVPLVLGIEYAVAIFLFVVTGAGRGGGRSSDTPAPKGEALVWVVSILSLIWFLVGSSHGILPMGNDPKFHMLLVGKILLTGHSPKDWLPFEVIPVNYATGSHLLVAIVSWLCGAMPHVTFKIIFAPLAFLTAGMLYLAGKELLDDRLGALLATMVWIAVANWGGLEYLRSGALPDMMGMLAFLGAIWAIAAESGPKRLGLIGLCVAGMILIHHHSALTGIAVLLAILVTDKISLGRLDERGRDILMGLILAALLVPFTILQIVWRTLAGGVSYTYALSIHEYFLTIHQLGISLGLGLALAGALGMGLALAEIRSRKDLLLPAWMATILVLFALFGYFYRALAFGLHGEFYGAFTPSNFMPELTYPLCLSAGYLFVSGKARPKLRAAFIVAAIAAYVAWKTYSLTSAGWGAPGSNIFMGHEPLIYFAYPLALALLSMVVVIAQDQRRQKAAAAAVIIILLATAGYFEAIKLRTESGGTLSKPELQDFNAIRSSLPPDVLLVNHITFGRDLDLYGWLPYWTWRECTYTPLPPSEAQLDSSVIYKRSWLEPGFQETILWANLEARPAAWILPGFDEMKYPGIHEFYKSPRRKVYLYDPGRI